MEITLKLLSFVMIMIFILIGLLLTLFFYDQLPSPIRSVVCGMLYSISFGSLGNTVVSGCGAIPS